MVVEPDELEELRDTSERAIAVDSFVRPGHRSASRAAHGPSGPGRRNWPKSLELIHDAMLAEGLHAIARMVLTKKEHIVRVRPLKGLLAADVLEYATRVKTPRSSQTNLGAQSFP